MKKFKDLIPGNSLYILCMNPDNDKPIELINCIVRSINATKTVVGAQFVDRNDKSKMIVDYFRVNPDSYINDSLKENIEHRVKALFETRDSAIENYIHYCEDKIQQYKDNINKIGEMV